MRTTGAVIGYACSEVTGTVSRKGAIAIHPNYRRQGYLKEAAVAASRVTWLHWMFTEQHVETFDLEPQAEGGRVSVKSHLPHIEGGMSRNLENQAVTHYRISRENWLRWWHSADQTAVRSAHFRYLWPDTPPTRLDDTATDTPVPENT